MLAQAFCHDEAVRAAFPDGIYWLTLGQEPALLAEQTRLLRMLGGELPVLDSSAQARDLLQERLADRSALVVLDDLWRLEHFKALRPRLSKTLRLCGHLPLALALAGDGLGRIHLVRFAPHQ